MTVSTSTGVQPSSLTVRFFNRLLYKVVKMLNVIHGNEYVPLDDLPEAPDARQLKP